MSFTVETFDLSLKSPETNMPLTANVYRMEGVNNGQPLSMAQLVMAICLARANEIEGTLIAMMDEMETTSENLERLTEIENKMVNSSVKDLSNLTNEERAFLISMDITSTTKDEVIADIESKMDSLNSFSQSKMIELQSQTNKRDQSYDMIANVLKSLNTVLMTNVNNM